jgi:hypothetical protein
MPFLKQSYLSFANTKLHEAYQFSNILLKSLDPNVLYIQYIQHFMHLLGVKLTSGVPC